MKPFMMATALAMLATPAYPSGAKVKIDKKCVERMQKELSASLKDAKYWCDPRTKIDCDKGHCE